MLFRCDENLNNEIIMSRPEYFCLFSLKCKLFSALCQVLSFSVKNDGFYTLTGKIYNKHLQIYIREKPKTVFVRKFQPNAALFFKTVKTVKNVQKFITHVQSLNCSFILFTSWFAKLLPYPPI